MTLNTLFFASKLITGLVMAWKGLRYFQQVGQLYLTLKAPGHFGRACPLAIIGRYLESRGIIYESLGYWFRGPRPHLGPTNKGLDFRPFAHSL